MDNWDNLRFLLALYRHKTMSAAALSLHTNVATVSRRIEKAAQTFGVPLFVKDHTGWTPTEAALPLIRVAEDFDARLTAEHNNRSAAQNATLSANVLIAAPAFVNTVILFPHVAKVIAEHPRLQLDLRNRGDAVGLGEADVMIRFGRPESGRVVARRLCSLKFRPYRCASPSMRLPGWIALEQIAATSQLLSFGERVFGEEPRLIVSLQDQQRLLMRSTGLAAILPDEIIGPDSDLEPLPDVQEVLPVELWMIYHATRREDAVIRVIGEWIVSCFRQLSLRGASAPELVERVD